MGDYYLLKSNGGDTGIKIPVLYWRCPLIRVSVIRGSTVDKTDSYKFECSTYWPVWILYKYLDVSGIAGTSCHKQSWLQSETAVICCSGCRVNTSNKQGVFCVLVDTSGRMGVKRGSGTSGYLVLLYKFRHIWRRWRLGFQWSEQH
jgi:hypothetical protein